MGCILTGRTAETDYSPNETSMLILTYGTNITNSKIFTNVDTVYPRKPDLEDFWNVESIGVIDKKITSGDDKAKEIFRDTLKFENGRYQVTWPWKERYPDLPTNHALAMGRLRSFVSKIKRQTELMQKYDNIIQEQVDRGVIEKIDRFIQDGEKHYLPHHAIITLQKSTTKVRVVYDASAKSIEAHKSQ